MVCDTHCRLPCSFIAVALLGSYAAQSELGDHSAETHGYTSEYLRRIEFSPQQNDELLDRIAELHRTHRSHAGCVTLYTQALCCVTM